MQKKAVTKTKFLELNDKQFYIADGITSLPFCHQDLKEFCEVKKMGKKIERYFWNQK